VAGNFVGISAGEFHTCAFTAGGTVGCWGDNSFGQLGDGTQERRLVPTLVSGLGNAVGITAGRTHTCAVLADGTVHCWGRNRDGQLGDGSSGSNRPTPVQVVDLTGVVAVAGGANHTCALLAEGRVRCWGANDSG
jgi:alpha-tubulin suppressor-like RCC1 family protein